MRIVFFLLLSLVFLVALVGAHVEAGGKCKQCGVAVFRENSVSWGGFSFCSQVCRETFEEKDRNRGWTCELCGVEVQAPKRELATGDTRHIWIGEPTFDGYCGACKIEIRAGQLDPDNPPAGFSRESEDNLRDDPYAVERNASASTPIAGVPKNEPREEEKEDNPASGVLPVVGVLAVVVVGAIRFLLK